MGACNRKKVNDLLAKNQILMKKNCNYNEYDFIVSCPLFLQLSYQFIDAHEIITLIITQIWEKVEHWLEKVKTRSWTENAGRLKDFITVYIQAHSMIMTHSSKGISVAPKLTNTSY